MTPALFLPLLLSLLLALSSVPTLAQKDDLTPIQQRIALTPGGMSVSWSTIGPIGVTPTVVYGVDPDIFSSTATGWTLHYDPSLTHFHHVVLNGLAPSTRYYWRVMSPANITSPILSFTTAPKPGQAVPFTVAVYGDMGQSPPSTPPQRLLCCLFPFSHVPLPCTAALV